MKKKVWWIVITTVVLVIGAFLLGRFAFPNGPKDLPAPELAEGQRGELGIDKNVNERIHSSPGTSFIKFYYRKW